VEGAVGNQLGKALATHSIVTSTCSMMAIGLKPIKKPRHVATAGYLVLDDELA